MKERFVITCLFILADIITGLIKALSTGSYDSSKMRAGLFHKLGEIFAWLLFLGIDVFCPRLDISLPFRLTDAITIYLVIMEIGSSIENIGIINPDIGKYLSHVFEKLKAANPETEDLNVGERK